MPRPRTRRRKTHKRPPLTVEQILAWADAFHAAHGRWPTRHDRRRGLTDDTWSGLDACLKGGLRGLEPGSSLAKMLLAHRGRRHHSYPPDLTVPQVLAWADAHHRRTGDWPGQASGPIPEAPSESWAAVEFALREGTRGLPGGRSVAQLLAAERGVRNHLALPPLTPDQILAWADAHHRRTNEWPRQSTGPVADAPGETWGGVSAALLVGVRGLPGGSSLARLLQAERGVRNPGDRPRLEPWEVLLWADAHRERTGVWPTADSGPVAESPDETWAAIDAALRSGQRGLPAGGSLARLLARRRGRRNPRGLPPLSPERILTWAEAHHRRTNEWPYRHSGPVANAPGETWRAVDSALRNGHRGLPGGSSIPRLLEAERGVRNPSAVSPLTPEVILAWADAHHRRIGTWPGRSAGPIPGAPGETWATVADALAEGRRGLSPGESLARLLADRRGVRNHMALPPLSESQVLEWADAHHRRTGTWPARTDGPIPESDEDTWGAVEQALSMGLRGLPGGDSLARFLARHRGKRNRKALPPLTVRHIRAWVRSHFTRTGGWPRRTDGPIADAPGETWAAVDAALRQGLRGLPGGDSLARLADAVRGAKGRRQTE